MQFTSFLALVRKISPTADAQRRGPGNSREGAPPCNTAPANCISRGKGKDRPLERDRFLVYAGRRAAPLNGCSWKEKSYGNL